MACSIKLVRLDDFIADIDSIDLSADGYSLAEDGYFPVVAPIGAKSVFETITLKLQGTSKDDLAAMTQELNDKIRQVQWWIDDMGVERYQVWIRIQQENETYSRQAMILNIVPPDKVRLFTPEEINQNYIGEYQIGIERTPFWEGSTSTPVEKTSINVAGGSVALSAAVNGDVPARLVKLSVYPNNTGTNNFSSVWMGFKTSRFGVAANFVPRWGLNSGIYGSNTSAVADVTAYTGYRIVTTFSSVTTLAIRASTYALFVSPSNAIDQRGTYLVLLRAKMSDTSVARARISYGFSGVNPTYRSRQIISGTAWTLYEMGTVKNPPTRTYDYQNISLFRIEVGAERISGSGELHCDSLILIPIDDGAIKITSPLSIITHNKRVTVLQAADERLSAVQEDDIAGDAKQVNYTAQVNPLNNWSLPTDDTAPVAVVAANDVTDGNVLNRIVDFTYTYISRWRTLRGNVV